MLRPDSEIHIQDPAKTGKRYLHTGRVQELEPGGLTMIFEKPRFRVEAGQEIVVFYNHRRKFVQQAAKVAELQQGEQELVLNIELVGEAVSAEGREHYRVSTISADLFARLGDEDLCPLVDISATGFAIIARSEHVLGETEHAVVEFIGETYEGKVCVQSVRELGRGRIRYGMRYLEEEASCGTLKTGLQKISLAVERTLLQNQSGLS